MKFRARRVRGQWIIVSDQGNKIELIEWAEGDTEYNKGMEWRRKNPEEASAFDQLERRWNSWSDAHEKRYGRI